MSRIYHNEKLHNAVTVNKTVDFKWNEDELSRGSGSNGAIIECELKGHGRISVTDATSTNRKFDLLYITPNKAHRRKFAQDGREIEPNFSETHKVRTGYLNSYKTEASGISDFLSNEELKQMLQLPKVDSLVKTPHEFRSCFTLWLKEPQSKDIELEEGDLIRVKTIGHSPFIYSIAKIDKQNVNVSNYAGGEAVGGSWTDKIMNVKADLPLNDGQGVDEDEWVIIKSTSEKQS